MTYSALSFWRYLIPSYSCWNFWILPASVRTRLPCYPVKMGSRVLTEAGRLEKFQKKYEGINYGQKESAE